MAIVYQDSLARGGFHPMQAVRAWIAAYLAARAERRRHRQEMADLSRFSDRELWDVGLSRSDLMSLELGVYRRD